MLGQWALGCLSRRRQGSTQVATQEPSGTEAVQRQSWALEIPMANRGFSQTADGEHLLERAAVEDKAGKPAGRN